MTGYGTGLDHPERYSQEQLRVLGLYGEAMTLAVKQPPLMTTQEVHMVYDSMGAALAQTLTTTDGYVPVAQIPEGGRRVTEHALHYARERLKKTGRAGEMTRFVVFDMPVQRYDGTAGGEPHLPEGFALPADILRLINGRRVGICEDIWDQGVTLDYVTGRLVDLGAEGVIAHLLVDKPNAGGRIETIPGLRKGHVGLAYHGDDWLIGAGCLDLKKDFGRGLQDLYECEGSVVKPDDRLPPGFLDALDPAQAQARQRFWDIWKELEGTTVDGQSALAFLNTIRAIGLERLSAYAQHG